MHLPSVETNLQDKILKIEDCEDYGYALKVIMVARDVETQFHTYNE